MIGDKGHDNNLQPRKKLQPKKTIGMSVDKFLHMAEGYFCKYNPIRKKIVKEWLESRNERRLALLFRELVKTISPSWRIPPCVAELEKANKMVSAERSFDLQPRIPEEKWEPETPKQRQEREDFTRSLRTQLEEKIEETSLTVRPHNRRILSPIPKLLPETPGQKTEREKMLEKFRAQLATLQKEEKNLKNKF